jgi:hypothetical protein
MNTVGPIFPLEAPSKFNLIKPGDGENQYEGMSLA